MNGFEIVGVGTPTIQITYAATDGPLAGVELVGGIPAEDAQHGAVVQFSYHRNQAALKKVKGLKKGTNVALKIAGRPDLAALVAAARDARAAALARFEAEAAALEPIGFEVVYGCDVSDRYAYLWPEGAHWEAIGAREKRGDLPAIRDLRARLKDQDWKRIAAETGAGPVEAGYTSYGGHRFDAKGLAAILALYAERAAEAGRAKAAKQAERDAADRERAERFADLDCRVVRRGASRGEEVDPFALVEIRSKATGETLRFTCRNIFDVGYVVNPAYPVEPGREPGGLATKDDQGRWIWDCYPGRGRALTDFEVFCLAYLAAYPPVDTGIRM